ncbi:MAG: hypothetical protein ACRDRU_28655 [Pseudonocardiaceae bacterium]
MTVPDFTEECDSLLINGNGLVQPPRIHERTTESENRQALTLDVANLPEDREIPLQEVQVFLVPGEFGERRLELKSAFVA